VELVEFVEFASVVVVVVVVGSSVGEKRNVADFESLSVRLTVKSEVSPLQRPGAGTSVAAHAYTGSFTVARSVTEKSSPALAGVDATVTLLPGIRIFPGTWSQPSVLDSQTSGLRQMHVR
jgi:hypothetical protein